jgi:hypothetical protein
MEDSMTDMKTRAILTVFDAEKVVGFVLARGAAGVEAFSAAEQPLGLFPLEYDAVRAIWRHARGQRDGSQ